MIPKFRACDINSKEIVAVARIEFDSETIFIANNNKSINDYQTLGLWRGFKSFILMQSTGVYDKHGVEIFEGDVVEHFDFNSNEISKSEVRILKGCFYLVISVDGFKYDVPMMDLKDDECILEIKGNVHENHELLEDV